MGVSLDIKPRKSAYPRDALPVFDLELRNDGAGPVLVCTYMLDYRIRASMVAESTSKGGIHYEMQPFRTWSYQPFKESDLLQLAPGEVYRFTVDLNDSHGFGFVQRHSQPALLPASRMVKNFEPGRYLIRVAISDRMALYVGEDGVHDFKLEARQLPDELPGGRPASGLVKGWLEGQVEIAWS